MKVMVVVDTQVAHRPGRGYAHSCKQSEQSAMRGVVRLVRLLLPRDPEQAVDRTNPFIGRKCFTGGWLEWQSQVTKCLRNRAQQDAAGDQDYDLILPPRHPCVQQLLARMSDGGGLVLRRWK
jgi:hypothetical protein